MQFIDGDTLVIFAGLGPHGLVNRDVMVTLTFKRGSGAKLVGTAGISGDGEGFDV